MTITDQKLAAYDHLTSIGLLPSDYLEKCDRDFDTGDIFWLGVPVEPQDAARALDGLSSRVDSVIDTDTMVLRNPSPQKELEYLEELNSMLMVLLIPSFLGWQVADDYKGKFATLLGAVWHKRKGWLVRRIKQRERVKTVAPAGIAAYLLDAPLDEFELQKLPYARALNKWLTGKVEWQIKKETREPSLDEPISDPDSGDKETTLVEVISDPDSHDDIVRAAERKSVLGSLLGILHGKEKSAVTKALRGEELSRTEQRAMSRGVQKMREFAKKHDVEFPA